MARWRHGIRLPESIQPLQDHHTTKHDNYFHNIPSNSFFTASRSFFAPVNSNLAAPLLGHCRNLGRHRFDHAGRCSNLSDGPQLAMGCYPTLDQRLLWTSSSTQYPLR
jgi:hypothetical protein